LAPTPILPSDGKILPVGLFKAEDTMHMSKAVLTITVNGEFADFERFVVRLAAEYAFLPPSLARHYARLYGARALKLLGAASSVADLGRRFGLDFFEIEARYLVAEEWAETADDVLVRRTKHGLRMAGDERAAFKDWMQANARA